MHPLTTASEVGPLCYSFYPLVSFSESTVVYNYFIHFFFVCFLFGQLEWVWRIQDGPTHMTGALALAANWDNLILFLMVSFSSQRVWTSLNRNHVLRS